MRKLMYIVLVSGFLFVDLLFFHDIFKAGETINIGQWLTGALSLLVIAISLKSLTENRT